MMPELPSSFAILLVCALPTTALLGGCGSSTPGPDEPTMQGLSHIGGKVAPASATERQVLEQLEQLPPGERKTIGDLMVVADPSYFSASGRICRRVLLTAKSGAEGHSRLACKDGASWFYVPDVFVPPGHAR